MAESIAQSVWFGEQYCSGPPQVIYQFDGNRKNWSSLLDMAGQENMFNHCGFGANSLFDGCCVNMLGQNTNVGSIHATKHLDNFMSSAKGLAYCTLTNNKLLQKYQKIMILDTKIDNPPCVESRLKCTNGVLYVYEPNDREMCNSNSTAFNLSSSAVDLQIDGVRVSGAMQTINQASAEIVWNTFVPAFLARPIPENLPFFISTLFTLMSIVGTLTVAGFYSYRFLRP